MLLGNVKDKPKTCVPVFLECVKDDDPSVRAQAIDNLMAMRPEAAEVMSALSKAIKDKDSDDNVRTLAIRMAGSYGAKAKPVVPALLELLDKPKPDLWFVELLDTLAAIGPGAKEALPKLRKLREEKAIADVSNSFGGRNVNFGHLIAQTIQKIEGE